MRTLIAGGGGFIGLNIAEALLRAGRETVLFDRAVPQEALTELRAIGPACTVVTGDVRDAAQVTAAFADGIDSVVYGAAITADAARDAAEPEMIIDINLTGLVRVLRAARDAGVRRVINLSSGSALGAAAFPAGGGLLDENVLPDPHAMYGITKFASERVAARLADLWKLDVRSVRLSAAFGPWERLTGVRSTMSPQFQIALRALAGATAVLERPCLRDWIYAPDIAQAALRLIEAPAPRHALYNFSTGVNYAALEWGEALAAAMPGSGFGCRLARAGESGNVALHGPADRASMATRRADSDLGFTATWGMDASAKHYADWMRSHAWCFEAHENGRET